MSITIKTHLMCEFKRHISRRVTFLLELIKWKWSVTYITGEGSGYRDVGSNQDVSLMKKALFGCSSWEMWIVGWLGRRLVGYGDTILTWWVLIRTKLVVKCVTQILTFDMFYRNHCLRWFMHSFPMRIMTANELNSCLRPKIETLQIFWKVAIRSLWNFVWVVTAHR